MIDGSMMADGDGTDDIAALREELSLAVEISRQGDESRQARVAHGQALLDRLARAGSSVRDALTEGGAPLAGDFADNRTVLDCVNTWAVRNPEFEWGRCLVVTLTYETGRVGHSRIDEVHLWSGFGVITTAEEEVVIVANHMVGESIVWSDSRLVPMGSMEEEQAVNDLASGLRDAVPAAIVAFLREYKRLTAQT